MIKCKKGDVAIEGTMAELASEYGTIRHYLKKAFMSGGATQEEAEKMLVISEATTRALDSFYEER